MSGFASAGDVPSAPAFSSAAPVGRVVYPGADEFGDGYAVFTSASRMVGLTEPLASFLTDVAGFGLLPVLMTRTDAVLSAHVVSVMGRLGGFWAVQDVDGLTFDALTGRRISVIEDLWNRPDATDSAGSRLRVQADMGSSVRVLGFDVYVEHPAKPSTRIGPLAHLAVDLLGGEPLTRWGVREPLTDSWSEEALTGLVQSQMPKSQTILAGSEDGGFASVQVSRTKTGLLEHATGGVVAPVGAKTVDLIDIASGALEQVARRFDVVFGVVSVAEYEIASGHVGGSGDASSVKMLVRRPRGYPPEVPLAVVVGAQATRDMGVDVGELRGRFDVRRVGPGGRAILMRLSGEGGLWGQFAQFAANALPRTPLAAVSSTGRTS